MDITITVDGAPRITRIDGTPSCAEPGEALVTLACKQLQVSVVRELFSGRWHIVVQSPSQYLDPASARIVAALWAEAVKVAEELERTAPALEG